MLVLLLVDVDVMVASLGVADFVADGTDGVGAAMATEAEKNSAIAKGTNCFMILSSSYQ